MSSDTLVIEENLIEEINETTSEKEAEIKYCLNCGTEINDRFCPHCGQSAATPSKLKMKNFGKGVLMSFGRLTPGFLNTAKGLMIHPWQVIRDHIHGKHVPYSPPITMLIQIFLYATLIFTGIDAVLGTDLHEEDSLFGYTGNNALLKMIDQSIVVSTFFVGIPICFAVYLAYYRHGAKKYNFAEYLAAFVYLFAAINLWDNLFSLLDLIPGLGFDVTNLTLVVVVFFSIMTLIKAFPQKSRWKSVALLLWCGVVLFISILALGILMYLPRMLERFGLING